MTIGFGIAVVCECNEARGRSSPRKSLGGKGDWLPVGHCTCLRNHGRLAGATILTLVFLPTLYLTLFGGKEEEVSVT